MAGRFFADYFQRTTSDSVKAKRAQEMKGHALVHGAKAVIGGEMAGAAADKAQQHYSRRAAANRGVVTRFAPAARGASNVRVGAMLEGDRAMLRSNDYQRAIKLDKVSAQAGKDARRYAATAARAGARAAQFEGLATVAKAAGQVARLGGRAAGLASIAIDLALPTKTSSTQHLQSPVAGQTDTVRVRAARVKNVRAATGR